MHQFIFNELSNIGLYNRQKREDFVIATKVRGQMGDGVNDIGLGRKHIMASCEASLRRLQTNYIDLYYVKYFRNQLLFFFYYYLNTLLNNFIHNIIKRHVLKTLLNLSEENLTGLFLGHRYMVGTMPLPLRNGWEL